MSSPEEIAVPAHHPGVSDPVYLQRRAAIAAVSADQSCAVAPFVAYTAEEDSVWRTVSEALSILHAELATDEYRVGAAALDLPLDRVPQLAWVSERLESLTGWQIRAVPGLVPTRTFYGALSERTFLSTQYVRHPSVPFYTPEPDIIHEMIGHANALGSPRLATLYEAAGRASRRAVSDAQLDEFSRVFWFTIEFGVAWEHARLRTYGAGLLSSFGEIQEFRTSTLRPFDISVMGQSDYDITRFQDVLFASPSFDVAEDLMLAYFASFGTD